MIAKKEYAYPQHSYQDNENQEVSHSLQEMNPFLRYFLASVITLFLAGGLVALIAYGLFDWGDVSTNAVHLSTLTIIV